MLFAALLAVDRKQKQPRCLPTDDQIMKMSQFTQWDIIQLLRKATNNENLG